MTLILNLMQGLLKQRRQGSVLDFFFLMCFFLFFLWKKSLLAKMTLSAFKNSSLKC